MKAELFLNKMKVLFWHRKNKKNAKNEAPIYCRITINGIRGADFTTNIFCQIDQFDAKRQQVVGNELATLHLSRIKHRIETIFLELEFKQQSVNPENIKAIFQGKKQLEYTFVQLMAMYRDEKERLNMIGEVSDASLVKCNVAVKNINQFLAHKQLRNLSIKGFSPKLATDYYYWLIEHKKTCASYSSKSVHALKSIINFGVLNELLENNPLTALRFSRGEKKKIVHLEASELKKLTEFRFISERLQAVADLFILQCNTGFAYADLHNFNIIRHMESDHSGRQWIIKPRTKNEFEAIVPVFPQARKIIDKYTHEGVLRLPVITNQKYNAYLKEIGDIVGVNVTLTTHVGRKTFGTLALNAGFSLEAVSKMLGHQSIRTTQSHYAVFLKKRIIEESLQLINIS